jgi:HEAT repeat protein
MRNLASITWNRTAAALFPPRRHRGAAVMLALLVGLTHGIGATRGEVAALWPSLSANDQPVKHDPELVTPKPVRVFAPRLGELWQAALKQEDALTRYQAADAIGRAFGQGFTAIQEATPALRAVVERDVDPTVRLAAATALIRLDDRAAAAALWTGNQSDGAAMLQLTDPALAAWGFAAAEPVWRQRLRDPEADVQVRRSALRALLVLAHTLESGGSADAAARMQSLHADWVAMAGDATEPVTLRLAAADAAAKLVHGGRATREMAAAATAAAQRLVGGERVDRLLAAKLLTFAAGQPHEPLSALLAELLKDADGAVRSEAAQALALQDAATVDPNWAWHSSGDTDAHVRQIAAGFMAAHPTAGHETALVARLGDPVPQVRELAVQGLVGYADNPQLRPAVERDVLDVVNGTTPTTVAGTGTGTGAVALQPWAGQASAAEAAGRLHLTDAGPGLVKLLAHERLQVRAAAARALRRIADPRTLDAITTVLQRQVEARANKKAPAASDDDLAELAQALGVMRHAAGGPVLERLIPKTAAAAATTRAAAVWALGKIHAGDVAGGAHLVQPLVQRLSDEDMMNPEALEVRQQAAIALGRMKATAALGALRRYTQARESDLSLVVACHWALEQITGQTQPPVTPPPSQSEDWFLTPLP